MTSLEETLRIEGGRVLATLIRLTGDIGLAEDAVQDAVVIALERWPRTGAPPNPVGWLMTTARNKALDRLRREAKRVRKEQAAMSLDVTLLGRADESIGLGDSVLRDDQLRLLFTCCHPALAPETRVALALRTIAGLTTTEIARAFLVPEPTMGQRLSRAKKKIATAKIPYRVPADHELPDRLAAVLAAVYVIFTTGHHAPEGALGARVDLADEAVRLARVLADLMPDEPECGGLLALLLATHARRHARVDEAGHPVLLANQDRSLWDRAAIDEASVLLERELTRHRPGPYQIQAAIACLHGIAPAYPDTDWPQIAVLYSLLEEHLPTPVVRVNRAVAVAEVSGPAAALALIDTVAADDVERWHLYWSTRANFLRRMGREFEARDAFDRALRCSMNDTDRRFLEGERNRA